MNKILIFTLFIGALSVGGLTPCFSEGVKVSTSVDTGSLIINWLNGRFGLAGGCEFSMTDYFSFRVLVGYQENLYRMSDTGYGETIWKPGVEARLYWPQKSPAGLFLGAGAEYWVVSFYDGSPSAYTGGGFVFPVRAGYKWIFGKESQGFYVEPYIGYEFAVGFQVQDFVIGTDRYGGLCGGINTGWAF